MFTAYDVYKSAIGDDKYAFGFSKEKLVKELRAFVDKIESEEYVFQSIETAVQGSSDDFTRTEIKIVIIEPIKKTV